MSTTTLTSIRDWLRREDGEHVGYIEMSADGRSIPYDRLWARRGEAMELDEAEAAQTHMRTNAHFGKIVILPKKSCACGWTGFACNHIHRWTLRCQYHMNPCGTCFCG